MKVIFEQSSDGSYRLKLRAEEGNKEDVEILGRLRDAGQTAWRGRMKLLCQGGATKGSLDHVVQQDFVLLPEDAPR